MLVIPLWKALSSFPLSKVLVRSFQRNFHSAASHFLHPQYKINKRVFMVLLFLSVKHWGFHAEPLWHFLCSRGASDYRKSPLTAVCNQLIGGEQSPSGLNKKVCSLFKAAAVYMSPNEGRVAIFHLIYFPDKEFPAKRSVASESAFLCWGQCSNNRL